VALREVAGSFAFQGVPLGGGRPHCFRILAVDLASDDEMLHTAQLGTAALQGWRCSARVGESRLRWSPGQGARVRSSWTAVGSISQGPGIVARENVSGRICLGVAGSSLETGRIMSVLP
jgi:hypothetical protein